MPRFLKGTTDHDGDGKMGGSLKETKMAQAPKKTPAKKPAAKKAAPAGKPATTKAEAERDAAELDAYQRGQHSRRVSIGRDQSPFGKGDKLRPHWEAGWDQEDGLRGTAGPLDNAVVNNPNLDQSGSGAAGQAQTVSAPKKG